MLKNTAFLFVILLFLYACQGNKGPDSLIQEPTPPVDTVNTINGQQAKLVNEYLTTLEKDSGFAGAVLIMRNDSLLLCKGYGLANRETALPFTPKTPVSMGSITKHFTAVAILKLYAQQKLMLNDPLSKFFPEVTADKKDITIHQLLTHSSGFHEFVQEDGGDFEKTESDAFLKRAFKEPLAYKPGTKAVYTNVGMSLLGIIIEKISGTTYENFLEQWLFKPAGIGIGYYPDTNLAAVGYDGEKRWGTLMERYTNVGGGPYWNLKANGGLYASIEDMYRWNQQLLKGKIMPDSLVKLMYTPHIAEDGTGGLFSFGYGCSLSKSRRNTRVIDNGGSNGIYFARWVRLPEEKVVMYVATTNSHVNANMVLPNISQLFFEGHVSQNVMREVNSSFESRGAEVLYMIMIEKGEDYFTQNAFNALRAEDLPTDDDMFFLEAGQRLISEKKWNAALALYLLYTKSFPQIVVAWNDLGEVYLNMNEKEKARDCFKKTLKIKPDNARAKRLLEAIN